MTLTEIVTAIVSSNPKLQKGKLHPEFLKEEVENAVVVAMEILAQTS